MGLMKFLDSLNTKGLSPDEICIADIAHALSLICRFNGHVKKFYSVAEHSLRVATILPYEYRLQGLLHDAAEAYVMDIPRPIKRAYHLHHIEEPVTRAIFEKYGVALPLPEDVLEADEILIATEARDLCTNTKDWHFEKQPLPEKIHPMKCKEVNIWFLEMAYSLGINQ